jgi:hypothetical protein
MEGNARTWFTPKQKAELWERWRSGQCVADIGGFWPAMVRSRMTRTAGWRRDFGATQHVQSAAIPTNLLRRAAGP